VNQNEVPGSVADPGYLSQVPDPDFYPSRIPDPRSQNSNKSSYLEGMSPYISLKIKKRHYEHHMIEAHK
jgi:hypothetical protein